MNRVDLRHFHVRAPSRFSGLGKILAPITLGLFLLMAVLVWTHLIGIGSFLSKDPWPEGLLVVLAAATTLVSLTRQLPVQNVLLAALLVVLVGAGVESLNSLSGLPLGPCVFGDRPGRQLFHVLPWPVPLIWLVSLLNSRGVARLVLRPWRQARDYGLWLLGATVLLALLLDFGLQPFATRVESYWRWQPTRLPTDWYGAPWVSFLGRGVTMLLLLAFATPALINKKPVKPPADYYPLVVWCSLNVLFLTGAVVGHLWAAAVLVGVGTLLASALAILGGVGLPSPSFSSSSSSSSS